MSVTVFLPGCTIVATLHIVTEEDSQKSIETRVRISDGIYVNGQNFISASFSHHSSFIKMQRWDSVY